MFNFKGYDCYIEFAKYQSGQPKLTIVAANTYNNFKLFADPGEAIKTLTVELGCYNRHSDSFTEFEKSDETFPCLQDLVERNYLTLVESDNRVKGYFD